MIVRIEAGVRARTSLEQRLGRPDESIGSRLIEPQVPRETEVCQRVPVAGAAFRRYALPGSRSRKRRTAPSSPRIAAAWMLRVREFGMRRQDRLRPLEGARRVPAVQRDARRFDESSKRVGHGTNGLGRFSRFQRNATYAARRRRLPLLRLRAASRRGSHPLPIAGRRDPGGWRAAHPPDRAAWRGCTARGSRPATHSLSATARSRGTRHAEIPGSPRGR